MGSVRFQEYRSVIHQISSCTYQHSSLPPPSSISTSRLHFRYATLRKTIDCTAVASVWDANICCMPFYCFTYKFMILNLYSYLIGNIIAVVLSDILDPVYKFTGNAFITQFIRTVTSSATVSLPSLATCQPGISSEIISTSFGGKINLLTINADRVFSVAFKSNYLLWCKSRYSIADLFHQFAVPRAQCFEIGFDLLDKY